MKKTVEPFWWALFGAGGVVSAIFMPALLLFYGILVPFGLVDAPSYEMIHNGVSHPILRLVLFGIISLSLFHWAHRFRFTLYDGLQVKHLNELIAVICYGGAIAGTVVAAYFMITF